MSRTENSSTGSTTVSDLSVTTVLENIPDAVVVADMDSGRVVEANDAAGDLFGCRPTDLAGRDHADLHPPDDLDGYYRAFRRGFGSDGDHVDRLPDGTPLYIETCSGEWVPVEVNPQRIETDGRTLVLGVFRDVTARWEREREIERTSTRLETLLDATPLPVAVLDTDGVVERWNRAAEETFGFRAAEAVGQRYSLFTDHGEFDRIVGRLLDGETLDGYETVHRAKDGSLVDVEIYARPLSEDGTVTGIVGSAIDVTDRKRRAQQLDVLHRTLRHNLRNAMTVVQGLAADLASRPDRVDASEVRETADRIDATAEDLVTLSEQARRTRKRIRAAARTGTNARPLSELLGALSGLAADDRGVTVDVSAATETASVPEQAEGLLTDLLEHVLASTDGGFLTIDAEVRERHVQLEIRGETALLSPGERELVRNGQETALKHGRELDIAQIYLVLVAVGGRISVPDDAPDGERLRVELPRTGDTESATTPGEAHSAG